MIIHDTEFIIVDVPDVSTAEMESWLEKIKKEDGYTPAQITAKQTEDGNVELEYDIPGTKFERIRRITGYLVGTTERWNSAKQAELADRVKHG